MSPYVGLVQVSSWTMLVSSPTIFLANDGMPWVGCHWSIVTFLVVALDVDGDVVLA